MRRKTNNSTTRDTIWRTLIYTCMAYCLSLSISTVKAQDITPDNEHLSANFFCEDDILCQRFIELCEEAPEMCLDLIRICFTDEDECERLLWPPECDEHEACEDEEFCEDEEECETDPLCEDDEDCEEEGVCEDEEQCDEDPQHNIVPSGYENPNPVPDQTVMKVSPENAQKASSFLHQATLGANYPLITQVASMGEEMWLETQFQEPIGYLFPFIDFMSQRAWEIEEESGEEQVELLLGGPLDLHMSAWWTQVMTSPDLVRQRIALALSEIFVISNNVELLGESPFAISKYYDTLLTHSFGNFRDLLKDISLDPAMAIYLSHLNNEKANPQAGRFPDENYAREVMQLFSIGLYELNLDGSRRKDSNGNDIPTYGQNEIREFAKVFTGLSMVFEEEGFGVVPGGNDDFYVHAQSLQPLTMFDAFHSPGEKRLLNGTVLPAGQTGMQDIDAAIDNLFNHPNVGPFIGKQLIQRLVKSNPSPAYVARVSAAFNGETGSPRGDMKAVIRAILLDPEAIANAADTAIEDGRLREPLLRLIRLARMFNATTPDRVHAALGFEVNEAVKQYVFSSPSVFNFFQPSYTPNGEIKDAGLVAPEFQITNASTIIQIKNMVDLWLEAGSFHPQIGSLPMETVTFDYELTLAQDAKDLIDHLDTLMTYGTLSQTTRDAILQVVDQEPDAELKVKKAVYLMAISPDFAIAL